MGFMAFRARRHRVQFLVLGNQLADFALFGELRERPGPIDPFQVAVQALRAGLVDKRNGGLFPCLGMIDDGTVAGLAGNLAMRFLAPQLGDILVTGFAAVIAA